MKRWGWTSTVGTWGQLACWDHNQQQTLIEAYVLDTHGELKETDLMESAPRNGRIQAWIGIHTPGIDRPFCIHDYLRHGDMRAVTSG